MRRRRHPDSAVDACVTHAGMPAPSDGANRYSDFLGKVDLLSSLTPQERMTIADALAPVRPRRCALLTASLRFVCADTHN